MSIKINIIVKNNPARDCIAIVSDSRAIAFLPVCEIPSGITGKTIKDAFTSAQENLGDLATDGDLLANASRLLGIKL